MAALSVGYSRHSGARDSVNPESRDSGFDAAHRPGMTDKALVSHLCFAQLYGSSKSINEAGSYAGTA
jgi:hypothetical protein